VQQLIGEYINLVARLHRGLNKLGSSSMDAKAEAEADPLIRWNKLARENAENAIVASMFEAGFKSSKPIETFSTWLLVGTTAVAAFLITNVASIVPFIGSSGFKTCGSFLLAACLFGLIARIYGLIASVRIDVVAAIKETLIEHLTAYGEEADEIKKNAALVGVTLETGVRMDRVFDLFLLHMPLIVKWMTARAINKYPKGPHMGYWLVVGTLHRQFTYTGLQVLAFLGFLVTGFYQVARQAYA
jgi:hypothetical protein